MTERKTSNLGMFTAVCLGVASFFTVQTIFPATNKSPDHLGYASLTTIDVAAEHEANMAEIHLAMGITNDRIADIMPAAGEETHEDHADSAMEGSDEDVHAMSDMIQPEEEEAAEDSDTEINPKLTIRAIGDENAPVVIEEFSSMTCPHCASFHTETLPEFKKRYIDTGMVRLIFRDYPLNQPALMASAIARCMPEDQYYNFTTILFNTQSEWMTASNSDKLLQTAKLAGLSDEALDECTKDRDLIKTILSNMRENGQKYEIQSTPTFIFNGGEARIKGARPLAEFETTVKRLMDSAEDESAADDMDMGE